MTIQSIQITSREAAPAALEGCGCCSSSASVERTPQQRSATATTASYLVNGMTCGHCTGAVTRELGAIEGVTEVNVDLVAGGTSTVTVSATRRLAVATVAAAVADAGYSLVEQPRRPQ